MNPITQNTSPIVEEIEFQPQWKKYSFKQDVPVTRSGLQGFIDYWFWHRILGQKIPTVTVEFEASIHAKDAQRVDVLFWEPKIDVGKKKT